MPVRLSGFIGTGKLALASSHVPYGATSFAVQRFFDSAYGFAQDDKVGGGTRE